jgi:superfamily II DNA or RNA helicase
MSIYITNSGTYLKKKDFKESELNIIKKELHVVPKSTIDYGETIDESFDTFAETTDKLFIPKFYALKKFNNQKIIDNIKVLNPIDIKFNGELRNVQQNVVDIVLDKISKNGGGGIISLPTGFGKTVIAINIATKLKAKTLIIVHKTFLANQWKERIFQYTNCKQIGTIQGTKIDTTQSFVIGMLQSISMKDYEVDIFKNFDLIIYDECHHLGAKVFSQALLKINSPYTLGLSATVARSDRTEKVFFNFLGDLLYNEISELKHKVKIEIHNYSIKSSRYFREVTGKNGKSIQPIMVSNLVSIDQRNSYIYDLIYNLKEKEPSRKMLILSGRIDQLKKLNEMLKDVFEGEIGFYIGGMKEKDLKISESKDLILATYEMVSEGLDIQALDTMLLLTPKAKVVQTIGRILRKKPEEYENQPLIIDIVDQIPSFIFLGMARKKVYTSRNYEIVYHNVKEGIIEKTWEHDYAKEPKDRQPKAVEAAFIDTDEEDDQTEDQTVDQPVNNPVNKVEKKETKKKETKKKDKQKITLTKEMIAFIEDDDDEPIPKPVKEDESKKAFEILDLLKVEINEVKKRVVRKKKTVI